jgi:hypothetical protein
VIFKLIYIFGAGKNFRAVKQSVTVPLYKKSDKSNVLFIKKSAVTVIRHSSVSVNPVCRQFVKIGFRHNRLTTD